MSGENEGYTYVERVGPAAAGRRLVDYLVSRYRHSTRQAWCERIAAGRVRLDGRDASEATVLRVGQELCWTRPPWREPDVPTAFVVLYRDDDLLAVAKPAGLPTLPGGGFLRNTLLELVRREEPRATPLHRLGRWTSGLVLFARSTRARVALCRDWRQGRVGKLYRALAEGRPSQPVFDVAAPIGPIPYPPLGTLYAACAAGRPARTRVTVVEQRRDAFLADVEIATGRPHQIRIHLAAAGHPLCGDPLYGPGGVPRSGSTALPGDPGYRLHAARLRIDHPATGRALRLDCPPPPVLRRTAATRERATSSSDRGPA